MLETTLRPGERRAARGRKPRRALRKTQKGFELVLFEEGVDGGAEGCEEEADQHDQLGIGT